MRQFLSQSNGWTCTWITNRAKYLTLTIMLNPLKHPIKNLGSFVKSQFQKHFFFHILWFVHVLSMDEITSKTSKYHHIKQINLLQSQWMCTTLHKNKYYHPCVVSSLHSLLPTFSWTSSKRRGDKKRERKEKSKLEGYT